MKWLIKRYMVAAQIDSISELAKKAGLTRRVLYDRINNPETFRVYEIKALDDVLKFQEEDLVAILRGEV